jgi:hypothetical protein
MWLDIWFYFETRLLLVHVPFGVKREIDSEPILQLSKPYIQALHSSLASKP